MTERRETLFQSVRTAGDYERDTLAIQQGRDLPAVRIRATVEYTYDEDDNASYHAARADAIRDAHWRLAHAITEGDAS